MVVADVENFPLLDRVRLVPQVFTPNGDDINDQAEIRFTIYRLIRAKQIEVGIYDLSGRKVRELSLHRENPSGDHSVVWDGRDDAGALVRPGTYLARVGFAADVGAGKTQAASLVGGGLLTRRITVWSAGVLACCALRAPAVEAQSADASGWGSPGLSASERAVPHLKLEYVTPRMHRWYAPRHLAESYTRPWYDAGTSYAREYYRNYLEPGLEGQVWYDTFGHRLGARLAGLYLGTGASQAPR